MDKVIRPAAPLLLLPLAVLWAGLFCAQHLVWQQNALPFTLLAGIGAVLLALLLICLRCRQRKGSALMLVLLSFVLGIGMGTLYWSDLQNCGRYLQEHPLNDVSIKIVADPKEGMYATTSLARIRLPDGREPGVRILWQSEQEPPPFGTWFTADASFLPLKPQNAWLFEQGLCGSLKLTNIHDQHFEPTPLGGVEGFREHNRQLIAQIDGEGSGLLSGVLLGDTTELSGTKADRAFKATGLSHLIAVSGSHLVVIATVLVWVFSRLPFKRSIELAAVALFLVAYVLLTGLQPSAIRACVMTLISSASFLVGRRAHAPSALCFAACVMLLLYPPNTYSVGFWLSVCAVLGLTMFCPLITAWITAILPRKQTSRGAGRRQRVQQTLIEPLGLTFTAQAATLPLTVPLFGILSLVSPLANLVVTPFVTLMVGGGIIALCLAPLFAPLAAAILSALSWVGGLAIQCASWLASLPHGALPVSAELVPLFAICLLVFVLLYLLWPQPKTIVARALAGALLCVALLNSSGALAITGPQVVVMDIGQGDAILVRNGGHTVLIDTGASSSALIQALGRNNITRLDAVVLTHLDTDHYGALEALVGLVATDHIFFAQGLTSAQPQHAAISTARELTRGSPPEELRQGDRITVGTGFALTVVWPDTPVAEGSNPESVCLLLGYDHNNDGADDSQMLLTGDAEAPELTQIMGDGLLEEVTILKVGHHGSRDAVTTQQLLDMRTELAFISVGANNRYGHPTQETLEALEGAAVTVYRTDLNGDITVDFTPTALRVHCATIEPELSNR
ncbi:MAG: DNA internalization-related competence protein ComEC/Rec2 [Coriobacteriales bacterium]|nr:DNA internalization-related competence protein ComEC/Rec2 [Coriobacteriales bacterium]